MAIKKYIHDIDLVTNKLVNARIHPVTTAERTALSSAYNAADEGVFVFDTSLDKFFVWDGNAWLEIAGLTSQQIQQINDAYNRSITGFSIASTDTQRTITLQRQDSTTLSDVYKFAHIHVQTLAQATWVITHNLGKYPSVSIVDSAEEEVIGEVKHNSTNALTVRFSAAFSGKAYLN